MERFISLLLSRLPYLREDLASLEEKLLSILLKDNPFELSIWIALAEIRAAFLEYS
jgi:hypothetical protein